MLVGNGAALNVEGFEVVDKFGLKGFVVHGEGDFEEVDVGGDRVVFEGFDDGIEDGFEVFFKLLRNTSHDKFKKFNRSLYKSTLISIRLFWFF